MTDKETEALKDKVAEIQDLTQGCLALRLEFLSSHRWPAKGDPN